LAIRRWPIRISARKRRGHGADNRQSGNLPKLEAVIQKIISPRANQPEPRYDLAALEAVLGKSAGSAAEFADSRST
jgi:hypothetical protein